MTHIWWLAAATTLVVTSFSMFGPVLAVLLQQRGYGTAAVGAFAMIPFACVALLIPLMPRIFARFGIVRCYFAGMVLETLCTLGYYFFDSLTAWCIAATLGGIGAAAVWNATEALLAQAAPPDQRGRVMGLYQTALGAALAAGPWVPALLRWEAKTTLLVACLVQLAALLLAWASGAVRMQAQTNGHTRESANTPAMGTFSAIRTVPVLAFIAFVGGVFEAGLSSVSAANGASLGLSLAAAASIVGVLGIGSFAFQYPAGMAADRFPPSLVFRSCGLVLIVSSALFAFATTQPWILWATALAWGGVGGALYTLTMIRVAHEFKASDAAAGTAAMISGYTLGGALGPVISGSALQFTGVIGMALWLGSLALAVTWLAQRLQQHASSTMS
jgi:MFS family permease